MLPFAHFKSEPTEYILAYRNGQVIRQGTGQSFWYWRPTTSIALLPISTIDALFALTETTANYQTVTVQGQVTYRIVEPATTASLLNFTIDPAKRSYHSNDPERLSQRVVNVVQQHTRAELQRRSLEEALRSADVIAEAVLGSAQADASLTSIGVACSGIFFSAIKTTPEIAKALEAEYRETLQKRADQAIYSRRADAVEQERKIRQNELSTSVELEKRRADLIGLQGENARNEATFQAEATRLELAAYEALEPRQILALAMRTLAGNAQKIGNLTITSEILDQLLHNS